MTTLKWIKNKLGITELEQRVYTLENQINDVLKHFGKYNSRTKEELELMKKQINDLIYICELQMQSIENIVEKEKAKSLYKKLKNNGTRITKRLVQLKEA